MSLFHKKMSQNFWATIMTNFLLAPNFFFGTADHGGQFYLSTQRKPLTCHKSLTNFIT